MKNIIKKNQPMFCYRENARKKNRREKVEGMTACLKKVECEWMENCRKKNQPMVTWKMQGKKIIEKKSKERQHVLRKLSVNGWKTL